MRLLAAFAAAAALLVFATSALASPVANDQNSYNLLGRVFPDPLAGCGQSGGLCSPYAEGNVPANSFIGIEEFISSIKYMNSNDKWSPYMEILALDGKLGDGAGNGKNPDIPGNQLDPEYTPRAESVSAGIPTSDLGRHKSDLMVVRVTDESVPDAGKKRYALSLSIHGIERAGAEGGIRAMEDLVTAHSLMKGGKSFADIPIVPDSVRKGAPTYNDVLKKTIIYFTLPNPDGWRRGSVSSGPDGGVFFQRYNGNGVDPNRDWPDIGYAFRGYSAVSEPETRGWIAFYGDVRQHGPFAAGDDLHGQPFADALSYTLLPHGRHRYDKNQRIQETAKAINASTFDRISWSPIVQANDQPQGGDVGCAPDTPVGTPCSKIYGQTWGSVYDTINYTTTGALGDWFDSSIGLNADGIDNEMSFSHLDKNINFDPHTEQLHVDGNKALIYAHLTNILEPQYDSSFDVGGRKGYVPNKRVKRDATKSQPDAPEGSEPQPDDDAGGPQPVPGSANFPFKVLQGPQSNGKNYFNGGMRVEVTSGNVQGIGTGQVTLEVQCKNCDEHPGVTGSDEFVTVAEDYNQSLIYAQAGVVATVNHPQAYGRDGKPVEWRAHVGGPAGVASVKVHFTQGRASEDGDTGGAAPPEQRAYDVANTDFFKDLNPFIPGKAQDMDTIDPRAVIDGKQSLDGFDTIALADDPLPGYVGPFGGVTESNGPTGPPTPDFAFESQGSSSGLGSGAPGTYEEKEFTIGPNDSDKSFRVTINWTDENNDFDLSVDRVEEDGTRTQVDSDGGSVPQTSETVLVPNPLPGKYVIVVDNYLSQDPAWKGTTKFEALPPKAVQPSDFTEAEKDKWFKALGDWVKGGGNLVLTDGALKALPELTSVPGTAISRQVVYAGQSSFLKDSDGGGDTLKDPLARGVVQPGARFNGGMRRQMYEPTPVGYAIQDSGGADKSNARQYDVDRAAWEKAGGRYVAGSADAGARDAQAVTARTTIGEIGVGGGHIRIAGALLPQPTEAYDHQFGLEPYAVTYTGYTMARNLLEALNRAKTPALRGTIGGRFVISRRAVKLRGGFARVRVSCRTPLGCVGSLRLAVRVKTGKKGKNGKRKTKLVRIGTKKFKYATKHRNAVLKVKVSKKGRRIVGRQKRRIKAHATAPVKFRDGLKGTARRSFWLYRPSHGKARK